MASNELSKKIQSARTTVKQKQGQSHQKLDDLYVANYKQSPYYTGNEQNLAQDARFYYQAQHFDQYAQNLAERWQRAGQQLQELQTAGAKSYDSTWRQRYDAAQSLYNKLQNYTKSWTERMADYVTLQDKNGNALDSRDAMHRLYTDYSSMYHNANKYLEGYKNFWGSFEPTVGSNTVSVGGGTSHSGQGASGSWDNANAPARSAADNWYDWHMFDTYKGLKTGTAAAQEADRLERSGDTQGAGWLRQHETDFMTEKELKDALKDVQGNWGGDDKQQQTAIGNFILGVGRAAGATWDKYVNNGNAGLLTTMLSNAEGTRAFDNGENPTDRAKRYSDALRNRQEQTVNDNPELKRLLGELKVKTDEQTATGGIGAAALGRDIAQVRRDIGALGYDPEEYLKIYSGMVNRSFTEGVSDIARKNGLAATALYAATFATKPLDALAAPIATIKAAAGELNPDDTSLLISNVNTAIRDTVREEYASKWGGGGRGVNVNILGKNYNIGEFVLNTVTSAVDSAVSATIAKGIASGIGITNPQALTTWTTRLTQALMSGEVYTDELIRAKRNGWSDGRAVAYAATKGLIEAATEKYSIEAILNPTAGVLRSMVKAGVAEGSEEVASDILGAVSDILFNGSHAEIMEDYFKRLNQYGADMNIKDAQAKAASETLSSFVVDSAESFLSGAFSGIGMNGAYNGRTMYTDYRSGQNIQVKGFGNDILQTAGTFNLDNNEELARALAKANRQQSEQGRVSNALMGQVARMAAKQADDVEARNYADALAAILQENGRSEEQARLVADAYTKLRTGQELTRQDKKTVRAIDKDTRTAQKRTKAATERASQLSGQLTEEETALKRAIMKRLGGSPAGVTEAAIDEAAYAETRENGAVSPDALARVRASLVADSSTRQNTIVEDVRYANRSIDSGNVSGRAQDSLERMRTAREYGRTLTRELYQGRKAEAEKKQNKQATEKAVSSGVDKVVGVRDDTVIVKTQNGQMVALDRADIKSLDKDAVSTGTRALLTTASQLGNANDANVMMRMAPDDDAAKITYAGAYLSAYSLAAKGVSQDEIRGKTLAGFTSAFGDEQIAERALNAAVRDATNSAQGKIATGDVVLYGQSTVKTFDAKKNARPVTDLTSARGLTEYTERYGGDIEGIENIKRFLEAKSRKTGIRYVFVDSIGTRSETEGEEDAYTTANGYYDPTTVTSYIALNSENPLLTAASHETYHAFEQISPEAAEELRQYVTDAVKTDLGDEYEAYRNRINIAYGGNASTEKIDSEITANGVWNVWNNEDAIRKVYDENPGLFEHLRRSINDFVQSLRTQATERFEGTKQETHTSTLVRAMRDHADQLEEISRLFEKAEKDASATKTQRQQKIVAGGEDEEKKSVKTAEELDKEYLAAVERGDMEAAQKMVDEAAEKAMSDSKIRAKDGSLLKIRHGTDAEFWEFDTAISGGKNGTAEGFGIYLSDDVEVTNKYGSRQIVGYANIKKPAYGFKKTVKRTDLVKLIKAICAKEAEQMVAEEGYESVRDALKDTFVSNYVFTYEYPSMDSVYAEVANLLMRNNDNDADIVNEIMVATGIRSYDRAMQFYEEVLTPVTGIDGFWYIWKHGETGESSNVFLAFDSSQIKSADPVTYDNAGNVIPLSRRFDSSENDIRYSIKSTSAALGVQAVKGEDGIVRFYNSKGVEIRRVTAEHIENESGIGVLIKKARENGFISQKEEARQYKAAADMMNMIMKTQDPEMFWAFAGSSMFSAVKSNSDPQYSSTIDFTTVCRKTQEMITAMSTAMKKLGRGLTKEEVKELQKDVYASGAEVFCPVCYVFSRWAGIGGILDKIAKYQKKYAAMSKSQIRSQIKRMEQLVIDMQVTETDANGKPKVTSKAVDKAKNLISKQIDSDESELENLEKVHGDPKRMSDLRKELKTLHKQSDGLDELSFARRALSPDFKPVPEEILFDLDAGDVFARDYEVVWKYRTSRGPSAGKAILPYSDMRYGDLMLSTNSANERKVDKEGNVYRTTTFTDKDGTVKVKGNFNKQQQNAYVSALKRIAAQNLIGGQRLQSTSDFRYEYALDYLQAFWELQALGAKVQTYTKVVEYADLIASLGGDVNLSVMPQGKGFENGKLKFSSVTGISFEAAKIANAKYDSAQLILVGINDEHIMLALDDENETGGEYIGFVIPYHASGASISEYIRGLIENLKESYNPDHYVDYSPYQEDIKIEKDESVKPSPEQKAQRALRKKMLTSKGALTAAEMAYVQGKNVDITGRSFEELLDIEQRAHAGDEAAMREYLSWSDGVLADLYQKMYFGEEADTKLTKDQAESVMPHEYWNTNTTRENAYVNGFIFRSYCERLGLHARFSGWTNKGKRGSYGDFTSSKGYWKLLIDRPMYDRNGNYRAQQRVNMTNFNKGMLKPGYAEATYPDYKIQEPNYDRARRTGEAYAAKKTSPEGVMERMDSAMAKLTGKKSVKSDEEYLADSTVPDAAKEITEQTKRFSIRTDAPPKKTETVYKLMRLKEDGKLYPLFIDSAVGIETQVWYDADSPDLAMLRDLDAGIHLVDFETGEHQSLQEYQDQIGDDAPRKKPSVQMVKDAASIGKRWMSIVETGKRNKQYGDTRRYYNIGINGSGSVSEFALRPGWHAGSLPSMRQIGKGPNKNLRDDSFVWVRGRVSADISYQDEANSNPANDIPTHIPKNGFYIRSTNADAKKAQADDIDWYIAGAFIADEILGDEDARSAIDEWNAAHPGRHIDYDYERESGKVFDAKQMKLVSKDVSFSKKSAPDETAYQDAMRENQDLRERVVRLTDSLQKAKLQLAAAREETVRTKGVAGHPHFDARAVNQLDTLAGRYLKDTGSRMKKSDLVSSLRHVLETAYDPVTAISEGTFSALTGIGYRMLDGVTNTENGETVPLTEQERTARAVEFATRVLEDSYQYVDLPTFADEQHAKHASMKKQLAKATKTVKALEQTLAETRERAENDVRKARVEGRMKERQRIENRDSKRALRKSIRDTVKRLDDTLRNGTDARHIPDELRKPVRAFVDVFLNDTSVFDRKTLAEISADYARLNKEDEENVVYDEQVAVWLDELQDELPELAETFDEVEPTERNKYSKLTRMSLDQLQKVNDIADHFAFIVSKANEIFFNGRSELRQAICRPDLDRFRRKKLKLRRGLGASDAAERMRGGVKSFMVNDMIPIHFFERLGGNAQQLWYDVEDGQAEWGLAARRAADWWDALDERYKGTSKWWKDSKENRLNVTLDSGENLTLTRDEIMALYATFKREQTSNFKTNHVLGGGIRLDRKIETVQDGKKGTIRNSEPYSLTQGDLTKMFDFLTDDQKSFADEAVGYLSGELAERANETSRALCGYSKFTERYYFPFKTDPSLRGRSVDEEKNKAQAALIKNKGFTKSTTANANAPLLLGSFSDIWENHVSDILMYAYMAPSQTALAQWFNYKVRDVDMQTGQKGNAKTMRSAIDNAYGKEFTSYIDTLLRDMSGTVTSDPAAAPWEKGLSSFKKMAVFANMSVVIQQPSAFLRAMTEVNAKYFATLPKTVRTKSQWAEMMKYSGVAVLKDIGGFDMSNGRGMRGYIINKDGLREKIDNAMGAGAEIADKITWVYMWTAVKKETAAKTGLKGEELLKAAGKRFDYVMEKTQVYDSKINKSAHMRSQDTLKKVATSFMAEPTKSFNMLMQGVYKMSDAETKADKVAGMKLLARSVAGFVAASVLNELLQSIVGAVRDKDEDRTLWEKYLANFSENLMTDMFVPAMLPYFRDVVSIMQGYDATRSDLSPVTAVYDAIEQTVKAAAGGGDWQKAIVSDVNILGILTGIPAKNLSRLYTSFVNVLKNTAYNVPEGQTNLRIRATLNEALDNVLPTFLRGYLTENFENYGAVIDALADGNDDLAEQEKESIRAYLAIRGKPETDEQNKRINTKLKTEVKERVLAGAIDDADAIRILEDELGVKKGYEQILEWRDGKEGKWSSLVPYASAFLSGDYKAYTDGIQTLVNNGMSSDQAVKKITDIVDLVRDAAQAKADGDTEGYDEIVSKLTEDYKYSPSQLEKDIKSFGDLPKSTPEEKAAKNAYKTGYDYGQLADAYIYGNKELYGIIREDMKKAGKSDKDIDSNLRSKVKEAYTGGRVTKEQAESFLKDQGLTGADLTFKLREWDGISGDYGMIKKLVDPYMRDGGSLTDVKTEIDFLTQTAGKEQSDVIKELAGVYKPQYVNAVNSGDYTTAANIKARFIAIAGLLGYTEAYESKYISRYWK